MILRQVQAGVTHLAETEELAGRVLTSTSVERSARVSVSEFLEDGLQHVLGYRGIKVFYRSIPSERVGGNTTRLSEVGSGNRPSTPRW